MFAGDKTQLAALADVRLIGGFQRGELAEITGRVVVLGQRRAEIGRAALQQWQQPHQPVLGGIDQSVRRTLNQPGAGAVLDEARPAIVD